jgi:hypothetical protein
MMSPNPESTTAPRPDWNQIPEEEWAVYRSVIQQARSLGVRFAFGGAFATAAYVGTLRNTKDFDLYVVTSDRERMQEATRRAGLEDYYDRLPYDRSWIYRASQGDIIVDTIWAMANHRADVDEEWLARGPTVEIRGEELRAIPIEELIWAKIYIIQRGRCDWVDLFNLIEARAESVDWDHLRRRMGEDAPLLTGVLSVFSWLSPVRATSIPQQTWARLGLRLPAERGRPDVSALRANLLDSRPWFHSRLG